MLGIGKWTGDIETSIISGTAVVEVKDNNGEYDFKVEIPGAKSIPAFSVYDIKTEGNRLCGKAKVQALGTLTVEISVEFDGDTFTGELKVPFLGTVPIKNGRRIG